MKQYITKDVNELIQTITKNQQYELMPILADALQEAGYPNDNTLEYLRNPKSIFFPSSDILTEILKITKQI